MALPVIRKQEGAFQAQYAELRERARAAGPLLPGTTGTLATRSGTGHSYVYRVYYFPEKKQREEFVGRVGEHEKVQVMRDRMEFSNWVATQVGNLRKLNFQVADKLTARVLVELYNRGAFQAGLVLVGTLSYMSWLNEYGASVVAARTMDIDVAKPGRLAFGASISFLQTLRSTGLPFTVVPGLSPSEPFTSAKLPGAEGLRVDLLAPGSTIGAPVRVPEVDFAAQTMPFYGWLLQKPVDSVVLAGWHCIPVKIPQAARMVWHKLYSSASPNRTPVKRSKDFQQAAVLAVVLSEHEPTALRHAFEAAPEAMITHIRPLLPKLRAELKGHPEMLAELENYLSTQPRTAKASRKTAVRPRRK